MVKYMKKLSKISLLTIITTYLMLNPVFARYSYWGNAFESTTGPWDVIVWIFLIIIAVIVCISCTQN